jgi:hypothetical protein
LLEIDRKYLEVLKKQIRQIDSPFSLRLGVYVYVKKITNFLLTAIFFQITNELTRKLGIIFDCLTK